MICKKCGSNISDKAKFCTQCGSKVEVETVVDQNGIDKNIEEIDSSIKKLEDQTISKTNIIDIDESHSLDISDKENIDKTNVGKQKDKNNKKKTLLFIILGIVLAVIASILLILSLNINGSSINTLRKALANFEEKGDDSATINLGFEVKSNNNDSMNLSATMKYQEINDEYKVSLTLNKSQFFDEMNLFARINERTATLYTTSDVIDMLGTTQSPQKMWIHYLADLNKFQKEEDNDLDFDDLLREIDKNHFKYVDADNSIRHYQLIIDRELIEKISSKLSNNTNDRVYGNESSNEIFDETYVLDFYINKYNELEKISIDLSNKLESNDVSSAILSISFSDLGRTLVTIPQQALSSNIDIETYMKTYAKISDDNNSAIDNQARY